MKNSTINKNKLTSKEIMGRLDKYFIDSLKIKAAPPKRKFKTLLGPSQPYLLGVAAKKYILIPDTRYSALQEPWNGRKSTDRVVFIVDVEGSFSLYGKSLYHISVKINKVLNNFSCSNNELTSLQFCPKAVDGNSILVIIN